MFGQKEYTVSKEEDEKFDNYMKIVKQEIAQLKNQISQPYTNNTLMIVTLQRYNHRIVEFGITKPVGDPANPTDMDQETIEFRTHRKKKCNTYYEHFFEKLNKELSQFAQEFPGFMDTVFVFKDDEKTEAYIQQNYTI